MNRFTIMRGTVAALALVAAMTACKKNDAAVPGDSTAMAAAPASAASVSSIELGKSLAPDNKITNPTSTFGVRDTIYAAVTTENVAAGSNLLANWSFQDGQLVDSTAQPVAPAGAGGSTSVTEFHITKSSAWPVGNYKVEFFLNGSSVGSKDFTIQ